MGILYGEMRRVVCPHCGREFGTRHRTKMFCDDQCRKMEVLRRRAAEEVRGYKLRRGRRWVCSESIANESGVYVVMSDDGYFKIGVTSISIRARISQMQTGSPRRLTAVLVIRGAGKDVERAIHKRLQEWQVEGSEWFLASRQVTQLLVSLADSGDRTVVAPDIDRVRKMLENSSGVEGEHINPCASKTGPVVEYRRRRAEK